jgi:hypothetical protein
LFFEKTSAALALGMLPSAATIHSATKAATQAKNVL